MTQTAPKIAIVCDWLTSRGGAEKIILSLHNLFPKAPIYTSIYNEKNFPELKNTEIITSNIQKLPFAKKKHQIFLPLMPKAFEKFNLDEYDIIISSAHSCAKGIITSPNSLHISYCHSPMRYAWDNSGKYINEYKINKLLKTVAHWYMHKLRIWDRLSADRVDHYIANSKYIKQKINKHYRKNSTVIHPFVNFEKFNKKREEKNYYLAIGRLTTYKKFDLIVRVSDEKLKQLYSEAKALIFPQIEDFGITPLEAMAAGCPVIALKKGGALETVIDKKTGIFFNEQTENSLQKAIEEFGKLKLNTKEIKKHAKKFEEKEFQNKILTYIDKKWNEHRNKI